MRSRAPFRADDLAEMDESLFSRASAVVSMSDVFDGHRDPNAIGLRHDCDAGHSLATAVEMAAWEAERGYRSTYYILHTSPYWNYPEFRSSLEEIEGHGHEIGIHTDALAEALRTGGDPDKILSEAIETLRGYGFTIRGAAGHGNPLCNRDRGPGEITFANDEHWVETARPQEGEPDRIITRGRNALKLAPRPLADFGLEYEALNLAYSGNTIFPFRISDSGGRWLNPGWEETVEKWQRERVEFADVTVPNKHIRMLHFLQHPDWYRGAYSESRVAA